MTRDGGAIRLFRWLCRSLGAFSAAFRVVPCFAVTLACPDLGVSHQCVFGVSFHLTQIVFANDGKSILHAWNDGFHAAVSARRESVYGARKRHVFAAVGRSGLGLHSPFLVFFTQPPLVLTRAVFVLLQLAFRFSIS